MKYFLVTISIFAILLSTAYVLSTLKYEEEFHRSKTHMSSYNHVDYIITRDARFLNLNELTNSDVPDIAGVNIKIVKSKFIPAIYYVYDVKVDCVGCMLQKKEKISEVNEVKRVRDVPTVLEDFSVLEKE